MECGVCGVEIIGKRYKAYLEINNSMKEVDSNYYCEDCVDTGKVCLGFEVEE